MESTGLMSGTSFPVFKEPVTELLQLMSEDCLFLQAGVLLYIHRAMPYEWLSENTELPSSSVWQAGLNETT